MHTTIAFSAVPLFVGALLSDWAYAESYQIEWANFASWLIAGGLLMAGTALLWGAADVLRLRLMSHGRSKAYLLLLLATVVLGFVNALVHARDGWAAMPTGLIMSVVVVVLAVAASAFGMWGLPRRAT